MDKSTSPVAAAKQPVLASVDINVKAKRLAEEFLKLGIKLAFGIPGSGPMLNFMDAFVKGGGELILCRHEGAAPIMAGTLARRQKVPVIAICADGTARLNLLAGISHCWFEKLPVIAVWDSASRQVPSYQKLQRLPEHNFSPFYKGLLDGLGPHIPETAQYLSQLCMAPDFGPVGVHLRDSLDFLPPFPGASTIQPSSAASIQWTGRAKRPVFIFGAAASQSEGAETLRKHFAAVSAPRLTTIGAKGFMAEDDPFSMRAFTGVGGVNTPENLVLQQADLVIGIHLRHSDVIKVKPFGKPTILFDTAHLEESTGFGAEQILVSSSAALVEHISRLIDPTWTAHECKALFDRSRDAVLNEDNEAARICEELSRLLYGQVTTVVDDGIYQKQSEYFWMTRDSRDYVATGVGRNMGSSVPAAVALALHEKSRPVVCLTGDGGLPMYLAELGLLSEHPSAKMLILHFADFSFGSMRAVLGQKHLTGSEKVVDVSFSHRKVLEGFGFKTLSTQAIDDLTAGVKQWLAEPGHLYVEFRLKRDAYPNTFFLIR